MTPTAGNNTRAKSHILEARDAESKGQFRLALRSYRAAVTLLPDHEVLKAKIADLKDQVGRDARFLDSLMRSSDL